MKTCTSSVPRTKTSVLTRITPLRIFRDKGESLNRVAQRVKEGGHNIPTEVIKRRYHAGIKNGNPIIVPAREVFTKLYNEPVPEF